MYPTLDQVLKSQNHELLLDSTSIVAKYVHKGKKVIYKELKQQVQNDKKNISKIIFYSLKKIDQTILNQIRKNDPIQRSRDFEKWSDEINFEN